MKDQLNEIIALLKDIKTALQSSPKPVAAAKAAPVIKSEGAQRFECEILEDEPKPSSNGEWMRYRARVNLPGFSKAQYCSVWIRHDKTDKVSPGSSLSVEGRLDGREYNGKVYYSIFVDHVFDTGASVELEEEEEDVPF